MPDRRPRVDDGDFFIIIGIIGFVIFIVLYLAGEIGKQEIDNNPTTTTTTYKLGDMYR